MIFNSLEAGGRGCITVAVACSMAGMIAGCITVTGLASKLIGAVVAISKSIPNPDACHIHRPVPHHAVLHRAGHGRAHHRELLHHGLHLRAHPYHPGHRPKVAAHFFVFYFGIVADITPPVALAAYAGSAIAKSDPMKTGVNATKLAIAAFVVPYIFAMNPPCC
jgi:TRAP-type uncharacterized transport system fused permease subunit